MASALIDVARGLCPADAPVIDGLMVPARFDAPWCAVAAEARAFGELEPR